MIKKCLKVCSILTVFFGILFQSNTTSAQIDAIDNLFNANQADVETLTKAYFEPFGTGFSTALNSGWVTKAAPTKTLGFSVQVKFAATMVPSSAQSFDANDLNLTGIGRIEGDVSYTVSGDKTDGQRLFPTVNGIESPIPIKLPKGIGSSVVPAAMIQANVGLIKGTDLTARYIPETSLNKFGNISLVGLGIKHGINQWIPAGKLLPIDISIMAAFTSLTHNVEIATNQELETTTESFVVNGIIGKKLPFISGFTGIGFQSGKFNFDLEKGGLLANPISYQQDSDAAIHAIAGTQVKIGLMRIYLEATIAEYVTYNVGLGIGLRN